MFFKKEYDISSDEELMHLVCHGDKKAFGELYSRYSSKLVSFMRKILGDKDKAEDFLQDVFMKIIEKPEQFDTTRKFSTWVYTVATNLCRNEIRNNATRGRIIDGSELWRNTVQQETFHTHIDRKQFRMEISKLYEELNERDKTIFVLRFQHELPIKDIAEILECPEGTVKSGTYYLLKKIAGRLPHYKPE